MKPRVYSCGCLTRCVRFVSKDKKPKEQEKRGDFLHRPFSKKLDKNLPSHKQPSPSLITQLQSTKALLKDRKASKSGFPDKGRSTPLSCSAHCVRVAVWAQNRGDCAAGKGPSVHPRPRDSDQAAGWITCAGLEKTEVGVRSMMKTEMGCIALQVHGVKGADTEIWQRVIRVLGTVEEDLRYKEL